MKAILLGLLVVSSVSGAAEREVSERALLAYMRVQPGTEQTFLKAAENVIAESRKEEGNLIYELHQSVKNPQQFVFYELFKTNADMQYHRNAKHTKAFLREVEPITVPGQFIIDEFVLRSPLE